MAKGWSAPRGSFVQSYGSDALDASGLLMLLTFFMAPDDPRTRATVDAIRSPATRGGLAADGLVYRYDPKAAPDGLPGVEGTFNMCSFWLVEALTRAGRTRQGGPTTGRPRRHRRSARCAGPGRGVSRAGFAGLSPAGGRSVAG